MARSRLGLDALEPGVSLLQKGDFERGWREYEWRWQRKQTPARPFSQPRWDGSPLASRTLESRSDASARGVDKRDGASHAAFL